ncbi:MAG: hypothetical protein F4018_07610 [Acidobacteria bacterium]|nr:hypothetical protein [Acidobacteriota bacterium]MYH29305.1 hypothetical protein [Acidobacteriota bacterium]MYK88210.1 hypothetical protein [Acidobacteriota bacterium]
MPERPRTWVIADTHFGHANIIRHGERPFRTLGEMDKALVANWNDTVGDDDTVYHLGVCIQIARIHDESRIHWICTGPTGSK